MFKKKAKINEQEEYKRELLTKLDTMPNFISDDVLKVKQELEGCKLIKKEEYLGLNNEKRTAYNLYFETGMYNWVTKRNDLELKTRIVYIYHKDKLVRVLFKYNDKVITQCNYVKFISDRSTVVNTFERLFLDILDDEYLKIYNHDNCRISKTSYFYDGQLILEELKEYNYVIERKFWTKNGYYINGYRGINNNAASISNRQFAKRYKEILKLVKRG